MIYAMMVSTQFTNAFDDDNSSRWTMRETGIDFLLKHTVLSGLLVNKEGTIELLSKNPRPTKLIRDSRKYYNDLNANVALPRVELTKRSIKIDGVKLDETLTKLEFIIVRILHDAEGSSVSTDNIMDILYKTGYEDVSIWSVQKTIQRIREKLIRSGIHCQLIQTIRGRGYTLVR